MHATRSHLSIHAVVRFASSGALPFLLLGFALLAPAHTQEPAGRTSASVLKLNSGEHVVYIGNTLADRMQHDGWLETYIHALHPQHELTFRNLAFPGDEVKTRPRSANFGSPDEWLTKTGADVVFCFFGYNEALRGDDGLAQFRKELTEMIDSMASHHYNGESPPRLVIFSPIAHENLHSRHLPDGTANNRKLAKYTQAMRDICVSKQVPFVDLFTPTKKMYDSAPRPLTLNGIHLLSHGNRAVAEVIVDELFGEQPAETVSETELERLRQAVLEKNEYWFSRYRVVDGYNVYGGRSKLAWHGQSNYDVMQREMEIFDVMTANRDKRVWAVAQGGDLQVVDDNLPPLLEVKTNRPGDLPDGKYRYLGGKEAIEKMSLAPGMQVNLFASEEMFPEIVNPVQMAVDPDGKLFVSVWPSYPHWNPTEPRRDRIVCLPDDDGDGVADRCIVFADELNSVTGLEFWGGGLLASVPPEIWFLKDTDGDDVADVRVRMLQGVSSADTHHSANAFVIGPDGGLYWSRGIFNVANMETPTKTFRSGSSGVYRFDPRTFEMNFHFPIGPNPHGDVFDQWGYQFANDGTSGTGSYVNIGKGIGNKQWFRKRVRPVAATGILSSSHFPEHNNGNFLICNTIGVLGVLQHKVKYNGADITAEEIEPILVSSDPNFRPVDVEIGGDGGLYIADWSNALIGHMQHNMRDPNRDHEHGRIYRVTCIGRPLLKPVKLKGKPVAEVLQAFLLPEKGTRYRARIELSGRDSSDVLPEVEAWAESLHLGDPAEAQALLESLWVFEEQRVPNRRLIDRILSGAPDGRTRAAAVRTLGHWGTGVPDWQPLLQAAAKDPSALVRAEAVKAAVSFTGLVPAEVIFEVANRPTDPELETVLNYAKRQIDVDSLVRDALASGQRLSPAAMTYVLRNGSVEDLLKLEQTEPVYRAILMRDGATEVQKRSALEGLAHLSNQEATELLVGLIAQLDEQGQAEGVALLGQLLCEQPAAKLAAIRDRLIATADQGRLPETRRAGFAAWITADRGGAEAFAHAAKRADQLNDVLLAVRQISDEQARSATFDQVRPLLFELPRESEQIDGQLPTAGLQADYFEPNPGNVAIETLANLQPAASAVVTALTLDAAPLKRRDGFALRYSGNLTVDRPGKYRFFVASDDGSRLYVGDKLVVNNDGLHGMVEKGGTVRLEAGSHPIVITYFDNGGGDGLRVAWRGPGFDKQLLPVERLTVAGKSTLHDVAIGTLATIAGHDKQKARDLAELIMAGRSRTSAIAAMLAVPTEAWPQQELPALASELARFVSEIPATSRTGPAALQAMQLTDAVAARLPADQAAELQSRIADLRVRVVRLTAVPHRMIYDKERLAAQAGKPIEFIFTNTDDMPHNFSVVEPGSLEEVGLLAEATARDPDAIARHYVPKTPKVLVAGRLLQPGQTQAISFQAPTRPGIYPYVCTYPGHWRRMYGALYVVADLKSYLADPEAYLAEHPLPLRDELLKYNERNTEWTYDDLAAEVEALHESGAARSFQVGQSVFKVANCVACHKVGDEGFAIGPDLTKLQPDKNRPLYILRSLVEPDRDIDDNYRSHTFELDSGKTISGLVVAQTGDTISVAVDPIAKADPVVLEKSSIEVQTRLPTSIMPKGLLNRLSREEILDLIAFVHTGGNPKHALYKESHDHQH